MWVPPVHSPFGVFDAITMAFDEAASCSRLEGYLFDRFGGSQVLLTDSGTGALQVALTAAFDASGDDRRRVALPAFGCYDIVTAALGVGAEVYFYDVVADHLGPDSESLRAALESCGIVVLANLFGYPLDWTLIRQVVGESGVLVIEDVAQGIGATWQGEAAGSQGDIVVLSFGRGKGWTGGSGGAALFRGVSPPSDLPQGPRRRVTETCLALAQWALARPSLYGFLARIDRFGLGETHFRTPRTVEAMSPGAAGLAWRSRQIAQDEIAHRRGVARRLDPVLRSLGLSTPSVPEGAEPAYLRLPVLMDSSAYAGDLRRLGCYRSYPRTLPDLSRDVGLPVGDPLGPVSGARELTERLSTLPTHSRVPEHRLTEALRTAFSGRPNPPEEPDYRP